MKLLKTIIVLTFLFPLNHILSKESEELIFCFVGDAGEVNPTQAKVVKAPVSYTHLTLPTICSV